MLLKCDEVGVGWAEVREFPPAARGPSEKKALSAGMEATLALLQARRMLGSLDFPASQRLERAALHFWHAYTALCEEWEPWQRTQAEGLIRALLARGTLQDTIEAIDEPSAQELCDEMAVLIGRLCAARNPSKG